MEAHIRLTIATREGRSYIRSLYTTPPLRVVSVGQLSRDNASHLMVMSTSPGVLSEDRYFIDITLEKGARLMLKSQSYQRIYDMDQRAEQTTNIKIADGAHLSQVPHPIVPHRNSSFFATSKVELGENSSILQGEIITCGRRLHGEEFEFREFSNSVEVWHKGRLRLKDRVWLSPKTTPLREIGLLEGATHQGTLIFQTTSPSIEITTLICEIHTLLSSVENIHSGISQTHYSGFVVRMLGYGGESLFEAMLKIQELMWERQQ
ncbi:MAG: urease accessory protein UreD [Rikenellaceae bacterium]